MILYEKVREEIVYMREKSLKGRGRCILKKVVLPLALEIILLFPYEMGAEIVDKIVTIVNGDIITLSELREISVPYQEKMRSKYSLNYDEEQFKEAERQILDQLIDERLVIQEADRLEIVIEEKDIDMAIRDVRESSKLSESQFKHALDEEGITVEEYREQLKNQMKKMRFVEQEIKSRIQTNEKEIESYYKEHKDSFNTPPEVKLQQILLMIPSEASEQEINQIRGNAEEIVRKIRNGEDFDTMVKLHSQDSSAAAAGDIGFLKQGELIPALNEVVFSLNVGELSSVIQSSLGFHIIRVLDKRERQKMTKEERWKEIEGILYNQKVEDKFKQLIKELRRKSYIKINL